MSFGLYQTFRLILYEWYNVWMTNSSVFENPFWDSHYNLNVCLSVRAHLWHLFPFQFVSTIWCSSPYIYWKLIIWLWQWPTQRHKKDKDTEKYKYKEEPYGNPRPPPDLCTKYPEKSGSLETGSNSPDRLNISFFLYKNLGWVPKKTVNFFFSTMGV